MIMATKLLHSKYPIDISFPLESGFHYETMCDYCIFAL